MDFKINELDVNTPPMGLKDEIVHDKPNIIVKSNEIRLKWVKGVVSIVSVFIIPQEPDKDPGAVKKLVGPNTFQGGDCLKENTKNCVYDESMITKIKCDGSMVKIGSKASNKNIACLYKCVDAKFDTIDECNKQLPETLKCLKKDNK